MVKEKGTYPFPTSDLMLPMWLQLLALGCNVMSYDRKILVEIISRKSHAPSIFGILGILLLISKLTQMTRPSQSVMMTRKMQNMSCD